MDEMTHPSSTLSGRRRLDGRVAVITGAANGIGRAFATRLAADGADVAICDAVEAKDAVAAVSAAGGRRAYSRRCDVTSADAVGAFARDVTTELGRCDILVHSAGIYPTAPFLKITYEDWCRVLDVNLNAIFHLGQAFLPQMVERGWGRIVAVSSAAFHVGLGDHTHYVASKGGLIGFVRSLAAEVGDYGVTVNSIAPGAVRTATTERSPQFALYADLAQRQAIKRTEETVDLVGALSFLVSDDAAFMTGQTVVVDGGFVRA